VLVDMVGDKDLNLASDLGSSSALRARYGAAAAKLGLPAPFDPQQELGVIDDHTPFQDRGIRDFLVLLDFQYGARSSPGPRWHTAGDTLDGVAAQSLDRVGRPLVVLLRGLAADRRGTS
jgi:peptidase M28-like protein